MFNFKGTPAPSSLSQIRSRISVSDPHLNQRMGSNPRNPQAIGSSSQTHRSPVRLPPIINKSQSFTGGGGMSSSGTSILSSGNSGHLNYVNRQQKLVQEPGRKIPSHREMLFLTLKHVKSSKGLTFDQLYSFITGAFEVPKSYTLESKLRKTLSNMASRGMVVQNPGIEPQYATYSVPEAPDSGPDLCINGRSVPEVSLWPNGYNLPAGGNLVCRSASGMVPMRKPSRSHTSYSQHHQQAQSGSRGGPSTRFCDPLPYMPIADPMICQSFGVRAGLKGKMDEHRPNSPTEMDYNSYSPHGLWMNHNNNNNNSSMSARSDEHDEEEDEPLPLCSEFPPRTSHSPPRVLDTTKGWSLSHVDDEEYDDPEVSEIYLNRDDGFHTLSQQQQQHPGRGNGTATIATHGNPSSRNKSDFETQEEYEENSRSCRIMNNIRGSDNSRAERQGHSSPCLAGGDNNASPAGVVDRMDYLLGLADIIDSYGDEPPSSLKAAGAASGGGAPRSRPTVKINPKARVSTSTSIK